MFRNTLRALALSAATMTAAVTGVVATPTAAHADPVGGRVVHRETVEARCAHTWTLALRGGETTRIRVSGDGDTCLELRVYDEFDNLVAIDTLGLRDDRQAFVTPKWTGKFKVKITNCGSVYNKYVMILD